MRNRNRLAAILAACSALLLAVSIAFFALTPGAWQSLASSEGLSGLLQTTAEAPDAASKGDSVAADTADDVAGESADGAADDAAAGENDSADESKAAGADRAGGDEAGSAKSAAAPKKTGSSQAGGSSSSKGKGSKGSSGTKRTKKSDSDGVKKSDSKNTSSSSSSRPAKKSTVTVSVSVSSSAVGSPVASSGTYTFKKGATAYDALCALGLSVNARSSAYGVYVAAIGGLAEKEHGSGSGWMYAVNGSEPSYSAGSYELADGDSVSWYYVTG